MLRLLSMKKLTTQEHVLLSENVLKMLTQNRLTTLAEFLQEDFEKLAIISSLSLAQVLDIRNHILSKYSARLVSGASLLVETLNKRKFIPTYIDSLDAALEGGLPVGCITEICGLASSGKTQICFQLAINSIKSECSVLYVDTKGDFSAVRVQKILHERGFNYKQMAEIMSKIHVVHIWTLNNVLKFLEVLKTGIIGDLGLLIIDSLPSLMLQHLGDDNKIGLILLNKLVNNIRFISKELEVAVICVNIQTRWLEQEVFDIDDEEPNLVTKDSFVERRNRCMGKYWRHIPSVLLMIHKSEYNKHEDQYLYQIQVLVQISRFPRQTKQCMLNLNEKGISV